MKPEAKRSTQAEPSLLGKGVSIKGRISGDGDLTIEGTVDGEVTVGGTLHIADEARVHANVEASSVVVDGVLEGDIASQGTVHVGANSTLTGTIRAAGFAMEEGASVSAVIEMDFDLPPELADAR